MSRSRRKRNFEEADDAKVVKIICLVKYPVFSQHVDVYIILLLQA